MTRNMEELVNEIRSFVENHGRQFESIRMGYYPNSSKWWVALHGEGIWIKEVHESPTQALEGILKQSKARAGGW